MKSDFIQVARLGKSVGLKGYVKLHNLSDFYEQFRVGAKFFDANQRIYTIKAFDKSRSLVLFEGFENVNLAKELTNIVLYQDIETTRLTCKLKKDEYFYFDIISCEIFENDLKLGIVEDIIDSGANFLFLIKTDENLCKQGLAKIFYLPYLDRFIKSVDVVNKQIISQNALEILKNS